MLNVMAEHTEAIMSQATFMRRPPPAMLRMVAAVLEELAGATKATLPPLTITVAKLSFEPVTLHRAPRYSNVVY
jgi:hypothetical protein